ncbi:MAG: PilZ domain-containing protein [Zoogloeaceae bacterium]|jgi:hypothetical protein|nr:PilZ domain-containing protein [Zoogloeaceae bacterium]
METNRRRFSRIQFNAPAELSIEHDACIPVKVLDISLKGALVQVIGTPLPELALGAACSLAIDLSEETDFSEGGILMGSVIAHARNDLIGLRCVEVDLDSITNLRRIVEFNLGDETILSQELERLSTTE